MYLVEMVDGSTRTIYDPGDGGFHVLTSDCSVEFRDGDNRLLAFFPVDSLVSITYKENDGDEIL